MSNRDNSAMSSGSSISAALNDFEEGIPDGAFPPDLRGFEVDPFGRILAISATPSRGSAMLPTWSFSTPLASSSRASFICAAVEAVREVLKLTPGLSWPADRRRPRTDKQLRDGGNRSLRVWNA